MPSLPLEARHDPSIAAARPCPAHPAGRLRWRRGDGTAVAGGGTAAAGGGTTAGQGSGAPAAEVGHLTMGNVIPTEARDAYLSRVAAIEAGCPKETPAFNVNRLCGSGLQAIISASQAILLSFHGDEPVELLLERAGTMPLPPYIAGKRGTDEADREDYQTMFAKEEGAVAAPTAALHFTDRLIGLLDERGVKRETLTLHVGAGTFLPVKVEDTDEHKMHSEWGRIDAATAIQFKEQMRDITKTGDQRVVLDLARVQFLDSSGLGAIVAVKKMLGPDRPLELSGLTTTVEKVFRLTRMDSIFTIHPSVEVAVSHAAGN